METGRTSFTVMVFLFIVSGAVRGSKKSREHTVWAVERRTGRLWCGGGVISLKAVITTCQCVCRYTESDETKYIPKDVEELFLKTSVGSVYYMSRSFVHRRCVEKVKGQVANDLGGWTVRGSFNPSNVHVLVILSVGQFYSNIYDDRTLVCQAVSYATDESEVIVNKLTTPSNQIECLDKFCERKNMTEPNRCYDFESYFLNSQKYCAYIDKGELEIQGSPVVCNFKNDNASENLLFGVANTRLGEIAIWTKIHTLQNEKFINDLIKSRSFRERPTYLQLFLIVLFLNHM